MKTFTNWQDAAAHMQRRKDHYKHQSHIWMFVAFAALCVAIVEGGVLFATLSQKEAGSPQEQMAPYYNPPQQAAQHWDPGYPIQQQQQPQQQQLPEGYVTPPHVLASIKIRNSNISCSATVISKGPQWAAALSAAHCFQGRIGGTFTAIFPNGQEAPATLLAIDRNSGGNVSPDLALFKVPSSAVIGTSFIYTEMPERGQYDAVGYSGGGGLRWKKLEPLYPPQNVSWGNDWRFRVLDHPQAEGIFWGGDSGGGVFLNGGLVGVISRSEYRDNKPPGEAKFILTCNAAAILQFVSRHQDKIADCGPWGCPPRQAPPYRNPFDPRPNVPIVPPPQGDPQAPAPPENPQPEKPSELQKLIEELNKKIEQLEQKIDQGLNDPRLQSEIEKLQSQIDAIACRPPELIQGPQGPRGRDGKDGKDGVITVDPFEIISRLQNLEQRIQPPSPTSLELIGPEGRVIETITAAPGQPLRMNVVIPTQIKGPDGKVIDRKDYVLGDTITWKLIESQEVIK